MSFEQNESFDATTYITSPGNPFVKELHKLATDSTAYRKQGRVWLEGDHLCKAVLARGLKPAAAVFSESFWPQAQSEWARAAIKNIVVADRLLAQLSGLDSPSSRGYVGFVLDLPEAPTVESNVASVILDRVQDAGNVGSILRSAAAFGFVQVIALKGTAALWSPKVVRAGMGAHFALKLVEGVELEALAALQMPIVVTSSHDGDFLHQCTGSKTLPNPCAWAMGHEGQGVSSALMAMASVKVRIAQPGGEESLNVSAAAAICFYASSLGRPSRSLGL